MHLWRFVYFQKSCFSGEFLRGNLADLADSADFSRILDHLKHVFIRAFVAFSDELFIFQKYALLAGNFSTNHYRYRAALAWQVQCLPAVI